MDNPDFTVGTYGDVVNNQFLPVTGQFTDKTVSGPVVPGQGSSHGERPHIVETVGYDFIHGEKGEGVCLIGLMVVIPELVAVETADAVPGGHPQKSRFVLGDGLDIIVAHPVGSVEVSSVKLLLPPQFLAKENQAGQHACQLEIFEKTGFHRLVFQRFSCQAQA
jgi:hypothetical protein